MLKKEKTYKFDKFGYAQLMFDLRKERSDKINKVVSTGVMLLLLGLGVMSKEFLILYGINLGINSITDLFIK